MEGRHQNAYQHWIPPWAVVVVFIYLILVGLYEWMASTMQVEAVSTCLFRRITGQPCPTCGTTRMVLALSNGEVHQAIRHNPLMFFLLVLAVVWLLARTCGIRRVNLADTRRAKAIAVCVVAGLFVGNWAYLILHA